MVQNHHLQLRFHPLLFCNFKWFNIKPDKAHDTVIQKELDELLAKGAFKPSNGDAGFTQMYLWLSSVLVVYYPFLKLSD